MHDDLLIKRLFSSSYSAYLIFILFILVGCNSEEPKPNSQGYFIIKTHNTAEEFFTGIPIELNFRTDLVDLYDLEWTYNGITNKIPVPEVTFKAPGSHQISVQGFGKKKDSNIENRRFRLDTTIHVIDGPETYGLPIMNENAKYIWGDSQGGFNLFFFKQTEDRFVLNLDNNFQVKSITDYSNIHPRDFKLSTSNQGTLYFVDYEYVNYLNSHDGIAQKQHLSLTDNVFDIQYQEEQNVVRILMDSASTIKIKEFNDGTQELSEVLNLPFKIEHFTSIAGYLGKDQFVILMRNESTPQLLILAISFEGDQLFSIYTTSLNVHKIWPLSNGWMTTPAPESKEVEFRKIGTSGEIEWVVNTSILNDIYLNYVHGPVYNVWEVENYIFILFDNFRIIKLNTDGEILWDKNFDLETSVFQASLLKDDHLVLTGARQINTDTQEPSNDYEERDLVFMKIDFEGNRID